MTNYDDPEYIFYKFLAKLTERGVYPLLSTFTEHVLFLFDKRFNFDNHIETASKELLIDEIVDCVNHVGENEKFKKLFNACDTEEDYTLLLGAILAFIFPADIDF